MTDTTTPGAGEGERWEKFEEKWEYQGIIQNAGWTIRTVSDHEASPPIATCMVEADADLICSLHNAREADQQTIANLETVVHAYKRAAENAEQTTRELRKALKRVVNAGYGEGITRQWAYDKACKALAATKEEKS